MFHYLKIHHECIIHSYTHTHTLTHTHTQLILVDKTDVSWWSMRSSSSGNQGLVPVNYIDKLDTADEKQADNTDGPIVQVNGTSSVSDGV